MSCCSWAGCLDRSQMLPCLMAAWWSEDVVTAPVPLVTASIQGWHILYWDHPRSKLFFPCGAAPLLLLLSRLFNTIHSSHTRIPWVANDGSCSHPKVLPILCFTDLPRAWLGKWAAFLRVRQQAQASSLQVRSRQVTFKCTSKASGVLRTKRDSVPCPTSSILHSILSSEERVKWKSVFTYRYS